MSAAAKKTKAELLAAREVREKAAAERAEAHELAVLELEDRFSTELGTRGVDFEIVEEGLETPIVVKRALGVVYTKWRSDPNTVQSTTEFIEASLVYPTREEFHAIAKDFPPIRERCENAIAALFKAKFRGDAGKF